MSSRFFLTLICPPGLLFRRQSGDIDGEKNSTKKSFRTGVTGHASPARPPCRRQDVPLACIVVVPPTVRCLNPRPPRRSRETRLRPHQIPYSWLRIHGPVCDLDGTDVVLVRRGQTATGTRPSRIASNLARLRVRIVDQTTACFSEAGPSQSFSWAGVRNPGS